jgi:hypothetical protein
MWWINELASAWPCDGHEHGRQVQIKVQERDGSNQLASPLPALHDVCTTRTNLATWRLGVVVTSCSEPAMDVMGAQRQRSKRMRRHGSSTAAALTLTSYESRGHGRIMYCIH